jgi:hypothetical protein
VSDLDWHTLGNESNVLAPLYLDAWYVLERCRPTDITLLQLFRACQQLCLLLLQMWGRFDEVDSLDAVCKSFEA